jgi:erythromycin esterase-like protein
MRTGFFGLDLYSLFNSMEVVVQYLDRVDPDAASRARYRYACFEHFGEDSQAYGYAASFGLTSTCERDAVHALLELQRSAATCVQRGDEETAEEFFHSEQNARLVRNAEEYYRSMFQGRVSSWNLRDQHMTETLQALIAHLGNQGIAPHIAVWAHNSHVGDARATEMGWQGELNVGQLVRQRFGRGALLVGLTTHGGTVTAADGWDRPAETREVVPALSSSFEALFHATGMPRFLLDLRGEDLDTLREPRLERAIGVVYRADTERLGYYFKATLKDQFDLVVHLDQTKALVPLERAQSAASPDAPETFPSGV